MIVCLDLPPGSRIDEAALCAKFGVSRTPLREAIKVLANDGLLISQPQRGSTVSEITREDIDALFPVLGVLKGFAGDLAAGSFKARDLAQFDRHAKATVKLAKANNCDGYIQIAESAHATILATANNPVLDRQLQTVWAHALRLRRLSGMSEACWKNAIASHEAFAKAAREGNAAKLAKVLRKQCADQHRAAVKRVRSQSQS